MEYRLTIVVLAFVVTYFAILAPVIGFLHALVAVGCGVWGAIVIPAAILWACWDREA